MIAVTIKPIKIPFIGVLVDFSMIFFNLDPAKSFKALPTKLIPYKNIPKPPNK